MAVHIFKLPFVSRCCSSTAPALLFSNSCTHFPAKLVRTQMHNPFRCFAVAKSGIIQIPKKKRRLDEICLERFQQHSRTLIQSWILQGKVYVDGKVVNKAGTPVSERAVVEIIAEVPKYSRIQVRSCY
ncbi:hypothetical protein SLEP1_g10968 [Rubroshorea leprosula]|uniref:RNA-binding S4 domain-containing protein n=1 Tax=Rubroshorea leprosula TaxID=152421 RepID=A0AAV5IJT4_9ROSI|nr:hypothetical protein SLEP1_g10968 [Rubroshorea leprosula]